MESITAQEKKKSYVGMRILIAIIILLLAGFTYEKISRYRDKKEYPPVGELIDVNGHNMHIWAKGTGDATVVFSVGYQIPSGYVDYYPLYSEIAKYARVAVYDRPGYGWSDVTDASRDIDTITKEIHEVLEESGEKPPYIFVAHSIASLEAIRFAQLYENEVKGIILLDGSSPDMYTGLDKLPSTTSAYQRSSLVKRGVTLASEVGVSRLALHTVYPYESTVLSTGRNGLPSLPSDLKEIDQALLLKAPNNKSQVGEREHKEDNVLKVLKNGHLGEIPLRIITSESLNSSKDSKEMQASLINWSTDSEQIIVKDAKHAIHWYNPLAVNAEILEMVEDTKLNFSGTVH